MPRKLESGGSYSYVLATDRDANPKPTFLLKIMNVRENDKLQALGDEYRAATDNETRSAALLGMLSIVLVGWSNMGGLDFSIEAAMDLLTRRECFELTGDATLEASLTHDERKKLESRRSLEMETSASVAAKNA